MPKIFELLDTSRIVQRYEILDFKQGLDFHFLKLKVEFVDDSVLYVREFVSENEFDYSCHWQDKTGDFPIRWDNSPHHPQVATFPHHEHTPNVEESHEIGLQDVLALVQQQMENTRL
ncbi:MAG: hypothetical protein DRO73_00890 [Candidatus Thorarchaeota archaeon]|nr:MAG: hypothetical protein DRO73_00890 [Candidatus Thorarchaeota archaeon]RLI58492.1 MAG: hypothetical protein DRO93_09745 [Candidatus Thorarchaeota archaeon]